MKLNEWNWTNSIQNSHNMDFSMFRGEKEPGGQVDASSHCYGGSHVILDRVMMKVMKENPQTPYLYYSGFIFKPWPWFRRSVIR